MSILKGLQQKVFNIWRGILRCAAPC